MRTATYCLCKPNAASAALIAPIRQRPAVSRLPAARAAPEDGPSTSAPLPVTLALTGLMAASAAFGAFAPSPAFALDTELAAQAVQGYMELDKGGKGPSAKALDSYREKYRVRRLADGRLQLRSSKGEWFLCRLDMEVPGAMLLRDNKGQVYALQTEALQQIDLSDDLVVLMMFADGDWEQQMSPVEFSDESGKVQQLKLEEKEFREVIGLLKEVGDLEQEQK